MIFHQCIYIHCCVLDGKIHIFATTQRDGPYKKRLKYACANYHQHILQSGRVRGAVELITPYFFLTPRTVKFPTYEVGPCQTQEASIIQMLFAMRATFTNQLKNLSVILKAKQKLSVFKNSRGTDTPDRWTMGFLVPGLHPDHGDCKY